MSTWSVYNSASGRLTGRTLSGQFPPARAAAPANDFGPGIPAFDPAANFIAANLGVGEIAIAGRYDAATYRVVAGAATARDPCPVTSSISGLVVTLASVPLGATVTVRGDAVADIVQDDASGALEITFPGSGAYALACDCFPAIDYTETFAL